MPDRPNGTQPATQLAGRLMTQSAGRDKANGADGRYVRRLRPGSTPGPAADRLRPPLRPDVRREGPVRRRRRRHDIRQPGLGQHASAGGRHRARGHHPVAGRRPAGRQDQDHGACLRPHRRERLAGHAAQSARAGPISRRLELRLGRRGRRRAGRFRARLRHRRLGSHTGQLLRPVRHPPDLRRRQPGRRLSAGAQLRHLRLVRPQRLGPGGDRRRAAAGRKRKASTGRCCASKRPGSTRSPTSPRRCAPRSRSWNSCAAGRSAYGSRRRASTASSTTSAPRRPRRPGPRSAAGSRRSSHASDPASASASPPPRQPTPRWRRRAVPSVGCSRRACGRCWPAARC